MIETQNNPIIAERYALEGFLASYGSVDLYQAVDLQLNRPVTLQVLTENAAAGPGAARTFSRHQKAASSIYHCGILAVYDAGAWDGRPFSVMEKYSGLTPTSLSPTSPPDIASALRITRQAAEALNCCRESGLSGWSFSPEAVTIDTEGNARLAVLEGLTGPYASSTPSRDPVALGELLRSLLNGHTAHYQARHEFLPMPLLTLLSLLDRSQPGTESNNLSTTQLIEEITALEQTALQPTEAYAPVEHDWIEQAAAPIYPSEAPTIAAQLLPSMLTATAGEPFISHPEPHTSQPVAAKRTRNLAALLAAAGVVLVIIAFAAALWPKSAGVEALSTGAVPTAVAAVAAQQPTPEPTPLSIATTPPTIQPEVVPIVEAAPPPDPSATGNSGTGQSKEPKPQRKDRGNDDDD
jgi:hypothetical protein